MSSLRSRHGNQRKPRASTGPRSAAGKARAAQNARRHGLSVPASRDPARVEEIGAVARAIAGKHASARRLGLARQIAAAQIDVLRVRQARRKLVAMLASNPDLIAPIARLDRYERDALARRKAAVREFGLAQPGIKAPADSQPFLAFFQNELPRENPSNTTG